MDYQAKLKEFRSYLIDNYLWNKSLAQKYEGRISELHLIYEEQRRNVGAILDHFDVMFLDDKEA